jgi:hypothetical protein
VSTTSPPPEATLIRQRREGFVPKLSIRAAAKKIGLSEGRWRQIESGYQTPTAGVQTPVIAPAETLARMAHVVGVTADELRSADRADAASLLEVPDFGQAGSPNEFWRPEHGPRLSLLEQWIEISFLADDVDAAVPTIAPEPEDAEEVETYISEVEDLVTAAESLTDAVHRVVLDAFGGDVARLRKMKREQRRANLAKQGLHSSPLFGDDEDLGRPLDIAHTGTGGMLVAAERQLRDSGLIRPDTEQDDERQIRDEALLSHYVDMWLRAIEQQGHSLLLDQARQVLKEADPYEFVPPEIPDELYVRYLAARHTAAQGGDPELHAAGGLTSDQLEAANARYRRERSEMILFDGRIRTAGMPADVIAEAINRVTPARYRKGGDDGA